MGHWIKLVKAIPDPGFHFTPAENNQKACCFLVVSVGIK